MWAYSDAKLFQLFKVTLTYRDSSPLSVDRNLLLLFQVSHGKPPLNRLPHRLRSVPTYRIAGPGFYSSKLSLHGLPTPHHLCREFLQTLQCDPRFLAALSNTTSMLLDIRVIFSPQIPFLTQNSHF